MNITAHQACRNSQFDLVVVATSFLIGLFAVWWIFSGTQTDFDDVGLGEGTTTIYQKYDDRNIHCSNVENAVGCLADIDLDATVRGLILGWSQLHGINAYTPGDRAVPWLLTDTLGSKGIDIVAMSYGNATPREHLIVYTFMRERAEFDFLILGAWLQGMRGDGVRSSLTGALLEDDVIRALKQSDIGYSILEDGLENGPSTAAVSLAGAGDVEADDAPRDHVTTQELSEKLIVEDVSGDMALFRARKEAEGQFRIAANNMKQNALLARNFLLGLELDKWKWTIPDSRYASNLATWEATLAMAEKHGTEVLVYVPARPLGKPFRFELDLYERYKSDIARLSVKYGATFINLEDVAGGDDAVWGKTLNGDGTMAFDGTHYTAAGHALVAAALIENIVRLKSVKRAVR